MSQRTTDHATFTIERVLTQPPARVFAAFTDPASKRAWFVGPDGTSSTDHAIDARAGGSERLTTTLPDGTAITFSASYRDVVPDTRLIYAYDMTVDDARISVSLVSIEFAPVAGGTRLTVTEHGIFLDALDHVDERRRGTEELLDKLTTWLDR